MRNDCRNFNCNLTLQQMLTLLRRELEAQVNLGLNGNQTHDLCDAGADVLTTELAMTQFMVGKQ